MTKSVKFTTTEQPVIQEYTTTHKSTDPDGKTTVESHTETVDTGKKQKITSANIGETMVVKSGAIKTGAGIDLTVLGIKTAEGNISVVEPVGGIQLFSGVQIGDKQITGDLGNKLNAETLETIHKIMKDGKLTPQEAHQAEDLVHKVITLSSAQPQGKGEGGRGGR